MRESRKDCKTLHSVLKRGKIGIWVPAERAMFLSPEMHLIWFEMTRISIERAKKIPIKVSKYYYLVQNLLNLQIDITKFDPKMSLIKYSIRIRILTWNVKRGKYLRHTTLLLRWSFYFWLLFYFLSYVFLLLLS